MRFLTSLLALALLLLAPLHAAEVKTPLDHKRVLVLGDSITQDGRYVTFLEYYLERLAPGAACDLISIGLSSETVSGLTEPGSPFPRPCALERLGRALKAVKPQLVLACYGMNDGIYHPSSPERLAAFNDGVRALIAAVRATGADLILITPPVFDPVPLAGKTVPATAAKFGYGTEFYVGYDDVLAEFAAAEVSRHEAGVSAVDLHTPMAAALAARRKSDAAFTYSKDGVHPGDAGHLLMARIIGSALGLPLPATELDAELARINADPVFSLISLRRRLRSEGWLPFVGYTARGNSYKSAAIDATEQAAKLLQGQIDARLATP
jgi:lysophospholipase L1-like esterase